MSDVVAIRHQDLTPDEIQRLLSQVAKMEREEEEGLEYIDDEDDDEQEVIKRNKTASQYYYRQHYLSIIQEEGDEEENNDSESRPVSEYNKHAIRKPPRTSNNNNDRKANARDSGDSQLSVDSINSILSDEASDAESYWTVASSSTADHKDPSRGAVAVSQALPVFCYHPQVAPQKTLEPLPPPSMTPVWIRQPPPPPHRQDCGDQLKPPPPPPRRRSSRPETPSSTSESVFRTESRCSNSDVASKDVSSKEDEEKMPDVVVDAARNEVKMETPIDNSEKEEEETNQPITNKDAKKSKSIFKFSSMRAKIKTAFAGKSNSKEQQQQENNSKSKSGRMQRMFEWGKKGSSEEESKDGSNLGRRVSATTSTLGRRKDRKSTDIDAEGTNNDKTNQRTSLRRSKSFDSYSVRRSHYSNVFNPHPTHSPTEIIQLKDKAEPQPHNLNDNKANILLPKTKDDISNTSTPKDPPRHEEERVIYEKRQKEAVVRESEKIENDSQSVPNRSRTNVKPPTTTKVKNSRQKFPTAKVTSDDLESIIAECEDYVSMAEEEEEDECDENKKKEVKKKIPPPTKPKPKCPSWMLDTARGSYYENRDVNVNTDHNNVVDKGLRQQDCPATIGEMIEQKVNLLFSYSLYRSVIIFIIFF